MTNQEYRNAQLTFIDALIQRYGINGRLDVVSPKFLSANEEPDEGTSDVVNGVFIYECMAEYLHRTNNGLNLEVYDTYSETHVMLPLAELCSTNLDVIIHRIIQNATIQLIF